jgi:hypothetical protein
MRKLQRMIEEKVVGKEPEVGKEPLVGTWGLPIRKL